jgi:DNA-directed RNA polymerase I, II, and III subunit RPABC1
VLLLTHRTTEDKLLVYFVKSEKAISTEDVKKFATKMGEESVFNGIIVSNKEMSPSADRLIKEIDAESKFHIEHFLIRELLMNITHHELVPKHIIVNDEEKKAVLKKYRIKESQLPKIIISDPVAKYLGLRRGQLVKIIRTSETAGLHVVYRIAV